MGMAEGRYTLPGERLESRFSTKYEPYDKAEAVAEANRCLYCYDAPCTVACPTSIDIPEFIRRIATDNVVGAAETILSANLLGASCARVCPVEVLCEGRCVYEKWGRKPISIGRLQRYSMENGAHQVQHVAQPATGFSIGLVGAGPASLACAGRLTLMGHETVIYEKSSIPGGLNTTGIAPYKMPALEVLLEVEFVESLGVKISPETEVGKDVSVDELLDRHDILFIAPGLGDDSRLDVPGGDAAGVVGAVHWIRRMKTDPELSIESIKHAAVIGGGNTAIDAARELAQLGIPDVKMVYRRGEKDMRGYQHEFRAGKLEGVSLVTDAVVSELEIDAGKVRAMKLVVASAGAPTDEPLGEFPVDLVVVAIGQARLSSFVSLFPGVAMDARGHIEVDAATGKTGNPRIFAGGDACNGGKEVVNAVDEGQRAATAIHELLVNRQGGKVA